MAEASPRKLSHMERNRLAQKAAWERLTANPPPPAPNAPPPEVKENPFEVYPDPDPAPTPRPSSPAPSEAVSEDHFSDAKVKLRIKKQQKDDARERDPDLKIKLAVEAGERKFEVNLHQTFLATLSPEEWEANGRADIAQKLRAVREHKEKVRAEKDASKKCDYVYLTWNPAPDTPLQEAHAGMQKFLRRKGYEQHAYSIEYHGEHGNHIHFHCLIRWQQHQNHQPSRFQQNCVETFDKWTDINRHTVNIKRLSVAQVVGVWNYICGQKPAEKMEAVLLDREWRQRNGLKDLYTSAGFEI